MLSKRNLEGYLMIDHRASPGIDQATERALGLPAGAGQGLFEAPTYTCKHCQTVCIVKLPRNQDPPYCPKCDHYICRTCETRRHASGGECRPFEQFLDQLADLPPRTADQQTLILPRSD